MKLNIVPARTGSTWVRLGIRTFFRQPLAMAGLFFMFMAVVVLLSFIPFIGPVVATALVPAATLGLMAATREAARGKFPMPSLLVSAFRAGQQRAQTMIALGAMYAAGSLAVQAVVQLALGGRARDAAVTAGGTAGAYAGADPAMLLALVLHTPLFLAFWHAPALVHWHGVPAVKSLFFSLVACLRNIGAYLVFGLLWLAVFMGVGLLASAILGLAGSATLAASALMPLAIVMAAMFSTSLWFTFHDTFDPAPPSEPGLSDPAAPGPNDPPGPT